MQAPPECLVCLAKTQPNTHIELKCSHVFCVDCIKKYLDVLRNYNLLTPQKLCCLAENCKQEIDDKVITKVFPGELGFILNIIKKRYKDSKDPNMVIFDCKGYTTLDRKPLIPKTPQITAIQHIKQLNALSKSMIQDPSKIEANNAKTCKNIMAFNKTVPRKQNYIQCNMCNCSYCLSCYMLLHQGSCQQKKAEQLAILRGTQKTGTQGKQGKQDQMDNFVQRNGILRCLNEKCKVAIAKEQGCFWVKCRCSWEMCYPCQKLWGDCQHFSKYPYKKFVPPPEWMVKALNLY